MAGFPAASGACCVGHTCVGWGVDVHVNVTVNVTVGCVLGVVSTAIRPTKLRGKGLHHRRRRRRLHHHHLTRVAPPSRSRHHLPRRQCWKAAATAIEGGVYVFADVGLTCSPTWGLRVRRRGGNRNISGYIGVYARLQRELSVRPSRTWNFHVEITGCW